MTFPECVGCGYCCISARCYKSVINYWIDSNGYCSKLVWDSKANRYWCQEALGNPEFREYMAIGWGCPSTILNYWRDDVKERR